MKTIPRSLLAVGIGALLFLVAFIQLRPKAPESRLLTLSIIGPVNQNFTATYTADGATHRLRALAPASIEMTAHELAYEIQREGGEAEFRVNLAVGPTTRTSIVSYQGQSVRGGYRLTDHSETVW